MKFSNPIIPNLEPNLKLPLTSPILQLRPGQTPSADMGGVTSPLVFLLLSIHGDKLHSSLCPLFLPMPFCLHLSSPIGLLFMPEHIKHVPAKGLRIPVLLDFLQSPLTIWLCRTDAGSEGSLGSGLICFL